MGLTYNTYLDGKHVYGCKNCKSHLANHEDIISRVRSPPAHTPHHFRSPFYTPQLSYILPLARISAASTARRISSTPS